MPHVSFERLRQADNDGVACAHIDNVHCMLKNIMTTFGPHYERGVEIMEYATPYKNYVPFNFDQIVRGEAPPTETMEQSVAAADGPPSGGSSNAVAPSSGVEAKTEPDAAAKVGHPSGGSASSV